MLTIGSTLVDLWVLGRLVLVLEPRGYCQSLVEWMPASSLVGDKWLPLIKSIREICSRSDVRANVGTSRYLRLYGFYRSLFTSHPQTLNSCEYPKRRTFNHSFSVQLERWTFAARHYDPIYHPTNNHYTPRPYGEFRNAFRVSWYTKHRSDCRQCVAALFRAVRN